MSNPICWLCKDNLVYKAYSGTKLLDDEGNKPCFDCMVESESEEDDNEF